MYKKLYFTCLAILLTPILHADQKEQLIGQLFSAENAEDFHAAMKMAKQRGVSKQSQLEARFLHYIDHQDTAALAKLAKELRSFRPKYKILESNIFSLEEDWLSIVEFTTALEAQEKQDGKLFKKHMTEAFWLSPSQASAYSPYVEHFKLNEAMSNLKLSNTLSLINLLNQEQRHLVLKEDQPISILYFWSPLNRDSEEELETLKQVSMIAKKNNIQLTTVIIDQSEEVRAEVRDIITEANLTDMATWTFETPDFPLSTSLKIKHVPSVVVYNNKGSILYNGSPDMEKLKKLTTSNKNK